LSLCHLISDTLEDVYCERDLSAIEDGEEDESSDWSIHVEYVPDDLTESGAVVFGVAPVVEDAERGPDGCPEKQPSEAFGYRDGTRSHGTPTKPSEARF
jgi:hypothetical protein